MSITRLHVRRTSSTCSDQRQFRNILDADPFVDPFRHLSVYTDCILSYGHMVVSRSVAISNREISSRQKRGTNVRKQKESKQVLMHTSVHFRSVRCSCYPPIDFLVFVPFALIMPLPLGFFSVVRGVGALLENQNHTSVYTGALAVFEKM